LTLDEIKAQEKEADELALSWFNNYVNKRNNQHFLPITNEEINIAKNKSLELMKKMKAGI
jgi:hypothetical protein